MARPYRFVAETTRLAIPVMALVALLALSPASGCTHAPANLSPQSAAEYQSTRVIKAMDVVREIAVAAAAQNPPLLKFDDRQKIVRWHEAAIKAVHAAPTGWTAAVVAPLDDIMKSLSPAEQQQLTPYVALVKTIVAEVR